MKTISIALILLFTQNLTAEVYTCKKSREYQMLVELHEPFKQALLRWEILKDTTELDDSERMLYEFSYSYLEYLEDYLSRQNSLLIFSKSK